jgi:hypothetical protein
MRMNKQTRNQLRSVVAQCRTLLERAVSDVLQGEFGIHLTGLVEPSDKMEHLSLVDRQYREQILTHLEHIKSFGPKADAAISQLVREASFTHLNRLCAYKMMERRELIKEAVSRGLKSKGFLFYLADHAEDEKLWSGGEQELAYRRFLDWLGATLSEEIGVLFSAQDLANRLFPPFRVLDRVLSLINSPELEGIWVEDEVIGWVYQYFTPKELRDQARDPKRGGSAAPRNSYELAFRNQFFTPRYVVEFLTDNTLARTWYEMQQGETALAKTCRYLVRRPREVFLSPGDEAPADATQVEDNSSEDQLHNQVFVKHRAKKDPREIKVLDPACGSGHFLLYCFDLLQIIYEEAYQDSELGARLREDFRTLDGFRKAVPGLILAHNLHGIDIDLRATQIAGLALWLRCQRAYKELEIKAGERPAITRSNIVCAEPMPGEKELLEEFVEELHPRLLGQLVRVVFEKMRLAGEAGILLKVEEEISGAIAEAKKLWRKVPKKEQMALFQKERLPESEQPALFDVTGITDEQFWYEAEARVVESLREYAQNLVSNGRGLLRRLFADDAAQGFAFVEICRKRFDVVLMNPPFGEATSKVERYCIDNYPSWNFNLLCAFVEASTRKLEVNGICGAITDRSYMLKTSYEKYRRNILLSSKTLALVVDLGWNVLDANVEVNLSVIGRQPTQTIFLLDLTSIENKSDELLDRSRSINTWVARTHDEFLSLPNAIISYALPEWQEVARKSGKPITQMLAVAKSGLKAGQVEQFVRLKWEVNLHSNTGKWELFQNGSPYAPFYFPTIWVIWNDGNWKSIRKVPSSRITGAEDYGVAGLTYGKRTDNIYAYVLPAGQVFSNEGMAIFPIRESLRWETLAFVNSTLFQELMNTLAGQHKAHSYFNKTFLATIDGLETAAQYSKDSFYQLLSLGTLAETDSLFITPFVGSSRSIDISKVTSSMLEMAEKAEEAAQASNACVGRAIEGQQVEKDLPWANVGELYFNTSISQNAIAVSFIQYSLGIVFGRWDVRYATGERPAPELPDPFAPLPAWAPGALTSIEGFPLRKSPPGYPLRIDWDGILVDDPNHEDDIIGRVREVLELLWQKRAEDLELEACALFGVKTLRDYFRKPAGGFWSDHVKRYSKSRRRAPIYWLLRSLKGSYAIWLYYHRLDKDVLYKTLINYVEPKLRMEENNLSQLRQRRETVGTTGRDAKQLEKELDKQESFISELHDFHDKLKRVADLHLEPDLNDGVVLNIAPLWELVPWTEAKKYWKELTEGEYEWSSISQQLRAKGLIKS